ncbi:hypothetical protein KSP39_PZI020600 [Platanthera zijinensis]|uniref:Uncharacterized protein n=1 Tax=Platanthera zijinensis TaxID=2320716 RepID=A0AAP0FXK9_9ASPA
MFAPPTPLMRSQSPLTKKECQMVILKTLRSAEFFRHGRPQLHLKLSRKERRKKNKAINSVLENLAESSKTISRCIQEAPKKSFSEFSIRRAIDKLVMYSEVQSDEDFYNFAITYFMDKNHRKTFLCLQDNINIK